MKTVAMAIFLSLFASMAQADNVVEQLVGNWVGTGQVRPQGFDKPQKIKCKVTGVLDNDLQVTFAGRCATSSGVGMFKIVIAQDIAGAKVAAKIRFSTTPESVDFLGSINGTTIKMTANEPRKIGARHIASEIQLAMSDNGQLDMQTMVTDLNTDEKSQALMVTFLRQD